MALRGGGRGGGGGGGRGGGRGVRGGRGNDGKSLPPPPPPPISSSIVKPQPSIDFVSLFKNAISSFSQPTGGIKVESLLEQVQQPLIDDSKQEARIGLEQGRLLIPMESIQSIESLNSNESGELKRLTWLKKPPVKEFPPGFDPYTKRGESSSSSSASSASASASSASSASASSASSASSSKIIKAKDVPPVFREVMESFSKPSSSLSTSLKRL